MHYLFCSPFMCTHVWGGNIKFCLSNAPTVMSVSHLFALLSCMHVPSLAGDRMDGWEPPGMLWQEIGKRLRERDLVPKLPAHFTLTAG